MDKVELSTNYWRENTRRLYDEIRRLQATKLAPVQALLAEKNYDKLEGSLISASNIHNPAGDSPIYREKRLNYVMLMDQLQPTSLLEIGFNWGYSASLLLESAPAAQLHSIDIGWHWYTPPTGELIAAIYPGRFRYTWKDSHTALREEIAAGHRYDVISIDGGHAYSIARADILLGLELLTEGGLLMIDDTDGPSVAAAVLATVADHPDMVELTAANFGLFEFGPSEIPCFEQRYFLKRMPLNSSRVAAKPTRAVPEPEAPPAPAPTPSLFRRALRKLKRLVTGK